jgi:hypothetical protein
LNYPLNRAVRLEGVDYLLNYPLNRAVRLVGYHKESGEQEGSRGR